jgi:hypothetical protein
MEGRKKKWLSSICSKISNNHNNGNIFSSCKNIDIGTLNAITYANSGTYKIVNKNLNNSNTNIPKKPNRAKKSSNIMEIPNLAIISSTAATVQLNPKSLQMFPNIKNLKDYKNNFFRFVKK